MCDVNSCKLVACYGLMANMKIIPKPIYTAIDTLSKEAFVCNLDYGGAIITVNSK